MSHTLKKTAYQTTTPTGLYEANFRRLNRLIPDLVRYNQNDEIELADSSLIITIQEKFKYTTIIELTQALKSGLKAFSAIEMELRVCHDANVLEVTGYQGRNPIQSALVYPNKHMLQVDEKKQLNLLLKDILENALKTERHLSRSTSPCD